MNSDNPGKLTAKQLAFVAAYLIDPNATAAYKAAGYQAANDNVAAVEGGRLLRNPKIAQAIARAQKARAKKAGLDAAEVLSRLDRESRRHGPGASHAARVQALRLLGLHLGMFPKKVQHFGPDDNPGRTAQDLSDDELAKIITGQADGSPGDAEAPPGPAEP